MQKHRPARAESTAAADIPANAQSFARHLRAGNKSPNTIKAYMDAVDRLDAYLEAHGMPRTVAAIRREHVEAFIEDQLARLKPASAANRYRSLQQFFRWLVDEGEIRESPMARMKPPTIPETPPPVLREDQLQKLLDATAGPGFDERRDRAIILLLVDTGIRLAEIAGPRSRTSIGTTRSLVVIGKGRRPRTVAFGRKVAKALDRYARVRGQHADAGSSVAVARPQGPADVDRHRADAPPSRPARRASARSTRTCSATPSPTNGSPRAAPKAT